MENWYLYQSQIVIAIQSLGDWLLLPMKFISVLGSEDFFLLALPVIYWGLDAALGLRIALILLASTGFNEALKMAFHAPRPYWFSSEVAVRGAENTFGIPSGHSYYTASVWGTLAAFYRKGWLWALAAGVIFLVGISRMYLGLHFPQDVLLGWGLGAASLWAFTHFWEPAAAWLKRQSLQTQILLAFGASFIIILMGAIPFISLQGWAMPAAWAANAVRGGNPLPLPVSMHNSLTAAGVLFGLGAGLAWLERRGGFQAGGSFSQRCLRLLVGLLGVMALRFGLGAIFPEGENLAAFGLRYLRYALIGAWVTAGAPLLFVRLKLAEAPGK